MNGDRGREAVGLEKRLFCFAQATLSNQTVPQQGLGRSRCRIQFSDISCVSSALRKAAKPACATGFPGCCRSTRR